MRNLIAFPYFGGKYIHLKWLLKLLPETPCFVDGFGGSASVILNRAPSKKEVYNDINRDVVNFFRVAREQTDELLRVLTLTPCAQEEYLNCCVLVPGESELERARKFFVRATQGFSGQGITLDNTWPRDKRTKNSAAKEFVRYVDAKLAPVIDRMRTVVIENMDIITLMNYYDSAETLFYLDPPYQYMELTKENRDYVNGFGVPEHHKLREQIARCAGKVAVSGYAGIMGDVYYGMYRYAAAPAPVYASTTKKAALRQEILWTNYEIPEKTLREAGMMIEEGAGLEKVGEARYDNEKLH